MRIAVACDGLVVARYFVQTTSFMIYSVERGVIVGSNNLPSLGQGVKQLAQLLKGLEIDVLIVGRIDNDMAATLRASGAELVTNAKDDPLLAAREYLSSMLGTVVDWRTE